MLMILNTESFASFELRLDLCEDRGRLSERYQDFSIMAMSLRASAIETVAGLLALCGFFDLFAILATLCRSRAIPSVGLTLTR